MSATKTSRLWVGKGSYKIEIQSAFSYMMFGNPKWSSWFKRLNAIHAFYLISTCGLFSSADRRIVAAMKLSNTFSSGLLNIPINHEPNLHRENGKNWSKILCMICRRLPFKLRIYSISETHIKTLTSYSKENVAKLEWTRTLFHEDFVQILLFLF